MADQTKAKAGRIGARTRWGASHGPSKQIRVKAETADRIREEINDRDRLSIVSEIIEDGLDRLKNKA